MILLTVEEVKARRDYFVSGMQVLVLNSLPFKNTYKNSKTAAEILDCGFLNYISSISFNQSLADASLGICQSDLGDNPIEPIFTPSGKQSLLNC